MPAFAFAEVRIRPERDGTGSATVDSQSAHSVNAKLVVIVCGFGTSGLLVDREIHFVGLSLQ